MARANGDPMNPHLRSSVHARFECDWKGQCAQVRITHGRMIGAEASAPATGAEAMPDVGARIRFYGTTRIILVLRSARPPAIWPAMAAADAVVMKMATPAPSEFAVFAAI